MSLNLPVTSTTSCEQALEPARGDDEVHVTGTSAKPCTELLFRVKMNSAIL
jgi:hypothetical protein